MLTTARGQPRVRPPAPFAMRKLDMLTPLRSPPKVVFVDKDADAVARRRRGVLVLDRQAQSLLCDDVRVTLRNRRVFEMAKFILEALPNTDLSREDVRLAAGIPTTDDFSTRIRQVRHLLRPFGIGVATAWGGRVIFTAPEAPAC
jgi:hypothetical protein